MHSHPNEDEMFLVVKGSFRMEYQGRSVDVREGDVRDRRTQETLEWV